MDPQDKFQEMGVHDKLGIQDSSDSSLDPEVQQQDYDAMI